MRKFICLFIVCLLSIGMCMNVVFASETKTYTTDDFKYDTIYHFNSGDKISFGGDDFEVTIYDDVKYSKGTVNEYIFDEDMYASIMDFSLSDDKYIDINKEYKITYNLSGLGDDIIDYSKYYWSNSRQTGESFAAIPSVPTATNYMFEYWCSDVELNNKIDDWDSYGEHMVFNDTTFYAKWARVELKCVEVKGTSETKPGESIRLQILPIANNERIYDVSEFIAEDRPIICAKINGESNVDEIVYDEVNNGYFYDFIAGNDEKEYIIDFYIKNNSVINTQYCLDAYDVNSSEVLLNNGWPWGSDFKIDDDKYSVSLNIKLDVDADNIVYQWQSSSDNANYEDIVGANSSSLTIDVLDYSTFINNWFRCYITYTKDSVNYQCVSKAVKILDSREINSNMDGLYNSLINTNTNRHIYGTLDGLYVSNGFGAYCLGSNGGNQYFNVLGKYNNGMKDYWTSASCDAGWTMYFKNSDGFVSENNIKEVMCNFDDMSNVVNIKYVLNNKVDASLYTDLCVGRFPEVYFADGAAIKANLNDNILDSIHLVTNSSFTNANLENDVGFVLSPKTKASAFNIDALTNGPYFDSYMGRYQYISNDYNNEEDLTYEDLYNALKSRIFDYNDGTLIDSYYGNMPFILRKIDGNKVVVGMNGKDSVLSCAWNNVDSVEFSMAIDNAKDIGINHEDIYEEKEEPSPEQKINFVIPKTGVGIRSY